MGKVEKPSIMRDKISKMLSEPEKKYDKDRLNIYKMNESKYVIAESIEEAVELFKDYQEKETSDTWRGDKIKQVELVSDSVISKAAKVTTAAGVEDI